MLVINYYPYAHHNEIYSHFSLQLGNTMTNVVPITYDINDVSHTEDKSIQSVMIIHWHVQITHTTVGVY